MANRSSIIAPIASVEMEIDGQRMAAFIGYVPEKGKPYGALQASREHFAALTESAFHLAGLVSRATDAAAPIALDPGPNGGLSFWGALVGSRARGHWAETGRIDLKTGKVTVAGLNELSSRTNGTSRGYNTSVERVREMAQAIRTGGTVKVKDKTLKFGAPVKIGRPIKTSAPKPTTSKTADAVAKVKAAAKSTTKPTRSKVSKVAKVKGEVKS